MAWNGTVTCSHCYSEGHNRRGCPQLKAYIKDNPDSFEARRSAMSKSTYTQRKCSFCHTPGHNRRACETMKDHKAQWIAHNRKWCAKMHDLFKEKGIGIGTLIKVEESTWNPDEARYENVTKLHMVKRLDWAKMNFEANKYPSDFMAIITNPVNELLSLHHQKVNPLPYHEVLNNLSDYWADRAKFDVVSTVDCTDALAYGPGLLRWLEGDFGIGEMFNGRDRHWVSNQRAADGYEIEGAINLNNICNLENI